MFFSIYYFYVDLKLDFLQKFSEIKILMILKEIEFIQVQTIIHIDLFEIKISNSLFKFAFRIS